MIKDEITLAQHELSRLKEQYKNLVQKIKETFYEKEEYFVEDSPRKPRGETSKMSAAYCLAQGKCPRGSYDLRISKAEEWKSNPTKYIEKWYLYSDKFKTESGTSPVIILKKKNIKLLRDICREMWVKEISNHYSPNTLLGFEDWMKDVSEDKILNLMHEHMNNRVDVVTDRNLFLKDIVIVYPHEIKNYSNNW